MSEPEIEYSYHEINSQWEPVESLPDEALVKQALERRRDTGDSLVNAFDDALAGEIDCYEFECALLAGDLTQLLPMLIVVRRHYVENSAHYLRLRDRFINDALVHICGPQS